MSQAFSKYIPLAITAGAVVIADQWTKSVVRENLDLGEVYRPGQALSQFIRIIHVNNYGAAGGIFPMLATGFAVLSIIVAAALVIAYPRLESHGRAMRLGLGMFLGGALGNLIDRLMQGYVTDFISIGALPTINLADAAIGFGAVLIILGMQDTKKGG